VAFSGPLILKGNLAVGTDSLTAADVSDQVLGFTIIAERDTVDIPATLASAKSKRAGGVAYSIKIDFFSSDGDDADLFRVFWDTFATADGQLYFEGSVADDAVSATNPLWSGTFIVTGAQLGGDAEGLSQDSQTFPLIAAPTIATS
jgi:hypothetical protein